MKKPKPTDEFKSEPVWIDDSQKKEIAWSAGVPKEFLGADMSNKDFAEMLRYSFRTLTVRYLPPSKPTFGTHYGMGTANEELKKENLRRLLQQDARSGDPLMALLAGTLNKTDKQPKTFEQLERELEGLIASHNLIMSHFK